MITHVQVDPDNRVLKLEAQTEQTREDDQARGGISYHVSERSSGTAYRNLRLPPNVDPNAVSPLYEIRASLPVMTCMLYT